jgi:hypothetical protein
MSLVHEQWQFTQNLACLPAKALELGLIMTEGESYRTPFQAWANSLPPKTKIEAHTPSGDVIEYSDTVGGSGINHSTHCNRLGKDYNFFTLDGKIINTKTPALIALGTYFESLNPKNRWGGNFKPTPRRPEGDIYHFERMV